MRFPAALLAALLAGPAAAAITEADLARLADPRATPAALAQRGLALYREEMLRPTPRPGPPYTEFRTHDWHLAQLTRKLAASRADLAALRAARAGLGPGAGRDCLTLLLVLRRQPEAPEVKEEALGVLLAGTRAPGPPEARGAARRPGPLRPLRLRELAAEALGREAVRTRDAALGRELAEALRSDVQAQYAPAKGAGAAKPGPRPAARVVYPVRRACAAAIRELAKAGVFLDSWVTAAARQTPLEADLPAAR